ncbi:MAG: helix-turn-helix domain-containing protein [Candidatus Magasanikbacteria bacterium]
MDLSKKLIKIGLSEKESKVYLACLQLGIDTVASIAHFAELKRPTVYLILENLENLGLVSKVVNEHKTLYKAEDPKFIVNDLRLKEEMARDILPSLNAIYNLDPAKPNIKISDGMQGVKNTYRNIFSYLSLHPQEELLIFGSLKDALANFESQVLDFFYESVAKTKNPVREIGNDDFETRKYFRASNKINPRHEIRLIRNEGKFFQTDNMLYGNNLVIFSVKEQMFATTIESAGIAETYRTLFNMAWKSGKPI